jgi:hypothetical protein
MTNQIGFPFSGTVKLKDAALIYAGEGFSIIPLHWIVNGECSCYRKDCSSPGKHPITAHGLKDASKDKKKITAWWKQYPKANIGVCTGQVSKGLTVIDFDLAKGADPDLVTLGFPITLRVETGGGFHLWFLSDQDIKNSASKLGQGIDIRGNGGYVVAPPSVHYSGKTYQFLNQDPITEFPDDLLAKLNQPAPIPQADLNDLNRDDDEEIILSYIPDLPDMAPEGSRNDFLARMGGKLRRQGFSAEEIETTLITANQKRCSPPLPDREVRQIAQSVSRYIPVEQIETGIEDEELDFDLTPDPDQEQQQPNPTDPTDPTDQSAPDPFTAQNGIDPFLGAMTADDFDLVVFGQPEMILQGLYKGEWGLVVGIGSVGKTTLLLNICISLAAGRPFLPIVPEGNAPRRVLFIDFEGPDFKLQRHVRTQRKNLSPKESALVGQNLHLVVEPEINGGKPWRLTDIQSLKNLAAYVQQHKIDLVIVDTLSQASSLKDENNNAEVQQKVVLPVRRLVRHCGISMLLVHHEGRGKQQNAASDMQYRGRGATALMDASRYQITAVPVDKDVREVIKVVNSKNKGEGFDPVTLTLDKVTRWFAANQIGTAPAPQPKLEDSILEILENRTDPDGMKTQEIQSMIPGASRPTLFRTLKEMVADGLLIKTKHGLYRPAPSEENGDEELENGLENASNAP